MTKCNDGLAILVATFVIFFLAAFAGICLQKHLTQNTESKYTYLGSV